MGRVSASRSNVGSGRLVRATQSGPIRTIAPPLPPDSIGGRRRRSLQRGERDGPPHRRRHSRPETPRGRCRSSVRNPPAGADRVSRRSRRAAARQRTQGLSRPESRSDGRMCLPIPRSWDCWRSRSPRSVSGWPVPRSQAVPSRAKVGPTANVASNPPAVDGPRQVSIKYYPDGIDVHHLSELSKSRSK